MLDHIGINVTDLAKSKAFYEQALKPLGYTISFGTEGEHWAFDIKDGLLEIYQADHPAPLTPVHVAFRAKSKAEVDAFHQAALAAGATDNGAPAPRPQYTPGYYGAFVLDPDGHNIEAMVDESK